MKSSLKKYIYLINDVTNILLRRERIATEEHYNKLKSAFVILVIILAVSIAFNIYFYFYL